jgi:hypothetical protein
MMNKEVQEFRSSGVQEFRSSGVQEFRSSGVQEFRRKEGTSSRGHDISCPYERSVLHPIENRYSSP